MSLEAITWAFRQQTTKGAEKLVLIALADRANEEDGECWPGRKYLSERTGLSPSQITRHLAKLVDKELIEVSKRFRDDGSQSSNEYRLCIGGVRVDAQGGSASARSHDPSVDPSEEPPPVIAPVPVEDVWAYYVTVMKPRRKELDADTRKIINNALKVATPAELCSAFDACQASDFHMKRNGYSSRSGPKFNQLGRILKPRPAKGETQRSRIDFWLDKVEDPEPEEEDIDALNVKRLRAQGDHAAADELERG